MSTLVQQNRKELSALLMHHKSDCMKKHSKTDHTHTCGPAPMTTRGRLQPSRADLYDGSYAKPLVQATTWRQLPSMERTGHPGSDLVQRLPELRANDWRIASSANSTRLDEEDLASASR